MSSGNKQRIESEFENRKAEFVEHSPPLYNSAVVTTKRWKGDKLQRRDRQVAPLVS